MAVRKGDGTIHIEEVKQSEKVTFFEKVPFVRGCIRFWKMMVTGTGALMKSAEISEEGAPDTTDAKAKEESKSDREASSSTTPPPTFITLIGFMSYFFCDLPAPPMERNTTCRSAKTHSLGRSGRRLITYSRYVYP